MVCKGKEKDEDRVVWPKFKEGQCKRMEVKTEGERVLVLLLLLLLLYFFGCGGLSVTSPVRSATDRCICKSLEICLHQARSAIRREETEIPG